MAIFTDNQPDYRRPPRGGGWFGWGLIAVAIIAITTIALVPSPYVIENPGPVYDVLSTVEVEGDDVALIEIPVEETFPTQGALDMLTVSIRGNRENPVNWLDIALAWLDPSKAVVPIDSIYPEGQTVDQANEENAVLMTSSQQEAIAAALVNLDYDVSTVVSVGTVGEGTPAEGVLEEGDVITKFNGVAVTDASQLRDAIKANGVDDEATISVTRDGKALNLPITPVLSDTDEPTPIVGIVLASAYEFPFEVTIQLEDVGGPSAGQMFALGIIDKLTPGPLNGGENVAGTGTITEDGVVGPIGGIRQKMYGALDAGATYFLAPLENCNEVVDHIPDGLTVFSTSSLDESKVILAAIADGGSTADLPTCEAQ